MINEIPHTHKAVMTVVSNGEDNSVAVSIAWEPDLEGVAIEELGYLPASYQFIQQFILPALEEAAMQCEFNPMMALTSPSNRRH